MGITTQLAASLNVSHPLQGLQFVVDNTFSPMLLSPARWGADIVVHSLTKFISGASDIVAGARPASPTLVTWSRHETHSGNLSKFSITDSQFGPGSQAKTTEARGHSFVASAHISIALA